MRKRRRPAVVFICLLTSVVVAACHAPPRAPDLGGLYNELAQNEDPYRNPVILIPGILGSKLVDRSSGSIVWGTFGFGNADPKDPSGARLVSLPMAEEKKIYVEKELEKRFGVTDHDVKFDIVAHSMGGLVARYYLRYGDQDLPSDGSLPKLNWAGSKFVDRLVMVGTPNGGALDALLKLVRGYHPALLLPRYPPAVLATMPSLYEMLPRNRHGVLLDDRGQPVDDILDPELWYKNNWELFGMG